MPEELEKPRSPMLLEWLMDVAARTYGMRVESCRQWDDYTLAMQEKQAAMDGPEGAALSADAPAVSIAPKQVDGPAVQALSGLQGRMAKGEKLIQGPERKMDRLENTHLEELEEGATQQAMSREKRMGIAWSETEQLLRELRKGNGGNEISENTRSNILRLYTDAEEGKKRLNDAANDPGKQDVSDSEAVMAIVAYETVRTAITQGGVNRPMLEALNDAQFAEDLQQMMLASPEVLYAAEGAHSPEFYQNSVLDPDGVHNLSLSAQAAMNEEMRAQAARLHPDDSSEAKLEERAQQHGVNKETERSLEDMERQGRVLEAEVGRDIKPESENVRKALDAPAPDRDAVQKGPVLVLQRTEDRE